MTAPHGALAILKKALATWTVRVGRTQSSIDPSWHKHLSRPWTRYALSSWFYSAVGLLVLLQIAACPASLLDGWPPRLLAAEAVLITLQGPLSYVADVMRIGRTSIAHPCDRCLAIPLVLLQAYKYGVVLPPVLAASELIWIWCGLLVGIFFKVLDYHALLAGDMLSFERSHFWWHASLPFVFAVHTLYLWFFKAAACAVG